MFDKITQNALVMHLGPSVEASGFWKSGESESVCMVLAGLPTVDLFFAITVCCNKSLNERY